jgi:peptide/nickel transport system substrate-binding protein
MFSRWQTSYNDKYIVTIILVLVTLSAIACSAVAPPTPTSALAPEPTPAPPTAAPTLAQAPTGPTSIPSVAPTVTPEPGGIVSATDNITLVIGFEPPDLNPLLSGGGITSSIHYDNMVDPLTWQSADDQRIVPTTATESWEQLAPDTWRFQLRQGVKFHNGEPWNAQAALPSANFGGSAGTNSLSYPYTGGFSAEAVDEYTLDIHCDQPCPIFPNTAIFLNFTAPRFYATATEEEQARQTVGFGPYKLVQWESGVSITQEAYDDYVPAGDHIEFQKPFIRNTRWLWRGETTVMAAMVQTEEADLAWDVGVDAVSSLPENMVKSGGSAEVFALDVNSLWHPELKKKKVRQAMAHAINCQEMIESLYGGHTVCRGNIIWPGVIGATEENTAPYEYNPGLARQLLEEASYDPNSQITILGRDGRIPKQVEVYEAVQFYLQQVGMNVEINVAEVQTFLDSRNCRIGKAVADVLAERGRNVDTSEATLEEFQAALGRGGASCPTSDLFENEPSNETLDFGRQASFYMNCARPQAFICDPSPGGIQEQLPMALAASGDDRQRRLQALADYVHENAFWIGVFDLPMFYAIDPKLNWDPRFDRRIRISTMWFSP